MHGILILLMIVYIFLTITGLSLMMLTSNSSPEPFRPNPRFSPSSVGELVGDENTIDLKRDKGIYIIAANPHDSKKPYLNNHRKGADFNPSMQKAGTVGSVWFVVPVGDSFLLRSENNKEYLCGDEHHGATLGLRHSPFMIPRDPVDDYVRTGKQEQNNYPEAVYWRIYDPNTKQIVPLSEVEKDRVYALFTNFNYIGDDDNSLGRKDKGPSSSDKYAILDARPAGTYKWAPSMIFTSDGSQTVNNPINLNELRNLPSDSTAVWKFSEV